MNNNRHPFKNSHLLVSVILILIIAITYGFFPEKIVLALAIFKTGNADISNAFKAIMGLYLGMAMFWGLGIIRPQFWYAATLTNIFFTLGLTLGRISSLVLDGFPSEGMVTGLVLELLLGLWGILSLRIYAKPTNEVPFATE